MQATQDPGIRLLLNNKQEYNLTGGALLDQFLKQQTAFSWTCGLLFYFQPTPKA